MNKSSQPQSHSRTKNFHSLFVSKFSRQWLPQMSQRTIHGLSQTQWRFLNSLRRRKMSWTIYYFDFKFSSLSFDVFDAWWHRILYNFHFVHNNAEKVKVVHFLEVKGKEYHRRKVSVHFNLYCIIIIILGIMRSLWKLKNLESTTLCAASQRRRKY